MRKSLVWTSLALCVLTAGCSSGPGTAPTGATSAPAAPVTQTPPPASASPSPPTKAEDAADLKKALVKTKDLGRPWVQPKSVSTVQGKKGEVCPGHVSTVEKVPVNAAVAGNFTEGRGAGKNIVTIRLTAQPIEDDDALIAAYAADQKACARFQDSAGFFVVRSAEGPRTFSGAEPVATWAERIYYDKQHKKLGYARHYLVVRQGRIVTYVSYAFLATKTDPGAKDFTRATRLLDKQLAKNSTISS